MYTNIRSFRSNKTFLEMYMQRENPGIVVLTETWMKTEDPPIKVQTDNYKIHEKRRLVGRGNGIAILVDKLLTSHECTPIQSENVIVVKILNGKSHDRGYLFVIGCYIPPTKKKEALTDVEETIRYLKYKYGNPSMTVIGDFNKTEDEEDIVILKETYNLKGIIDSGWENTTELMQPTCKTRRIDYPLFSNVDSVSINIQDNLGKSDHKVIKSILRWGHNLKKRELNPMSKVFLYKKCMEKNLNRMEGLQGYLDLSKWLESKNKPIMLNKRNFYTKKQKEIALVSHTTEEIIQGAGEIEKINKQKFSQYKGSIVELVKRNDTKKAHKVIKSLIKAGRQYKVLEGLKNTEGEKLNDKNEVEKVIYEYYKHKYGDEGYKRIFTGIETPKIELSVEEFNFLCKKINTNKSNGFDYVPLKLIENNQGKEIIRRTINTVLQQEKPNERVFATRLVCLNKTSEAYPSIKDTRPLAVTTLPQKLLELMILDRLKQETECKIATTQFGFREKRETLMHLIRLIDRLKTIRKDSEYKRGEKYIIFIDFSSAFDTIIHEKLIEKLQTNFECSDQIINLIKWYLNQIRISTGEKTINQNRGSPQGGIASPLMWLIYINDLMLQLEATAEIKNVFAYADDLMIICRDRKMVEKILGIVQDWSTENGVMLNKKKSAIMPLVKRKLPQEEWEEEILGIPLVKSYKYLGIIFTYDMKFGHTLEKTSGDIKELKNFYIIGKKDVPLKLRLNIWKTYYYSKILYPLIALILMNKTEALKIEARISGMFKRCLGLNRRLKRDTMYNWIQELGPRTRAELSLLRTMKKLEEIGIELENKESFMELIQTIDEKQKRNYFQEVISIKKLKEEISQARNRIVGISSGTAFHQLDKNTTTWLKWVTGDLELYQWRDENCRLCNAQLVKQHILICPKLASHRTQITDLTTLDAEEVLLDPSLLNRTSKEKRCELQRIVADKIVEMVNQTGGNSKGDSRIPHWQHK